MAYAEQETIEVTTDASGNAVVTSQKAFTGRVQSIQYVKDDFADGVDFSIEAEGSGQVLWAENNVNAAKTVRPRAPVHTTAGVAHTVGSDAVLDHIWLAHDRIKITIAEGGDTKAGKFIVTVG